MPFSDPPRCAAWRHRDARDGFEVVFLGRGTAGLTADGTTTAVEDDEAWTVRYAIALDHAARTRSAAVMSETAAGRRELTVAADGAGRWRRDDRPAPELDGCLDVDLESSALTNAFPVHRLGLRVGQYAEAPAAYVRALDLRVERLAQRYERLPDMGGAQRYRYAAPAFDFECELVYDRFGLLVDYPGIAARVA
jgi:uncharacterized protein